MLNIGPQELLLILLIALIVVGPNRLPELARQIGRGLREFRKLQDEVTGMVKLDLSDGAETPRPSSKPASPTAPGVHRTPRAAAPGTPSASRSDPAPTPPSDQASAPDPAASE